jgi:hypothetical protein
VVLQLKDLEASNAHLEKCLRKTELERNLAEQRADEVQRAAERRAAEDDARREAEERERERWREGEMARGVTPAFIQAQLAWADTQVAALQCEKHSLFQALIFKSIR